MLEKPIMETIWAKHMIYRVPCQDSGEDLWNLNGMGIRRLYERSQKSLLAPSAEGGQVAVLDTRFKSSTYPWISPV
jgi:hypothetical protein